MRVIVRGERLQLDKIAIGAAFSVEARIVLEGSEVDYSLFGLDETGRLSDERYLVFYNRRQSPCGGLRMEAPSIRGARFTIDLERLPASLSRLTIAATVDGDARLNQCRSVELALARESGNGLRFTLGPSDLGDERALMLAEIYRKDGGWRLWASGQGFAGGLAALIRHLGGEVEDSPPPRLSLEKKAAAKAPELLSLAKLAGAVIEERRLTHEVARVALVLDGSGSMHPQYRNGRIQELIDRLLPLALHFDDDGTLDCWVFGERPLPLPGATAQTYRDYVASAMGGWRQWMDAIGRAVNNEPAVIRDLIETFGSSALPVYVIFVSDGGIAKSAEIARLLAEASRLPIFWQFVGIGGRNYGILERLDTMTGRAVDNAGFFALDDLHSVSEQGLYDRLLAEFPAWLTRARAARILL